MTGNRKQLSNAFSTGGGGPHFEAHVQASYVTLMLTGGFSPCLRCLPIREIKLQGKIDGFDTDDLIVFVQNPDGSDMHKLLGQVKHGLRIGDNKRFREVAQAAWDDFCDCTRFTKGKDVIAVISDSMSTTDTEDVGWLLEQARCMKTPDEFLSHVDEAKFSSNQKRKKLTVFREQLKKANKGQPLSDSELHEFLKHFYLLGYDLGKEEGVVLSLLHSHISQYNNKQPRMVWARIVDIVQTWNQNAGTITIDNLPQDLLDEFKRPVVETIPAEIAPKQPPPTPPPGLPVYACSHNLAQAFLMGGWKEDSAGDVEIVTEFAAEEYDKWILPIREALEVQGAPLGLRNGTWTTKRNLKTWEQLGPKLYDIDLEHFEKVAVKALSESNPAFDLPGNERYMANIRGKIPSYSNTIREGVSDALAVLGSCPQLFPHCTENKPETVAILVVRQVLTDVDWRIWGSLNNHLPLLAEAAPGEFLFAVERALQQAPCPFRELFAQEGSGVMGNNYMTGLLWALETLAWDEQHLTRVAVILGELSAIDSGGNWSNRPKNSLTTIFLPWLPQTLASIERRKTAIRTLVKEVPKTAWQTLISLLPSQHQMSSGSHKPRWRMEIPEKSGKGIPMKEYWEQVSCYADLALKIADGDPGRLMTLIGEMDHLPPPTFDGLLTHLQSDAVTSLPEEERTKLWSSLVEFTARHRRYSDADWALRDDKLTRIDDVAAKLSPKGLQNLYRRIFNGRDDLYEEEGGDDWREQERRLEERRQKAIGEIYKEGGIEAVLDFAKTVESAPQVGAAFGVIAGSKEDLDLLPRLLNKDSEKLARFISSYIWARRWKAGWDWVDQISSPEWTAEQLGCFFRSLPFGPEAWKRVSTVLGKNEGLYWKSVVFNAFQAEDDFETAIDKLLEYDRPYAAIDCLNASRHKKNPLDHARTIKALLAAVNADESPHSHAVYECVDLIKALQEDPKTDQDALFNIEWAYLNALDGHGSRGARPRLLEQRLASIPTFFCEIIRIIFRSRHEEKREKEPSEKERKIAGHAYRLLHEWSVPPGTLPDRSFSTDVFKAWLTEMKETCEKTGHVEVAMSQLGQVLIYTPSDPDGLWIHKTVAEALNAKDAEEMRRGFHTGVFNSRGVVCVDPSGKPEDELAAKYNAKADAVEAAGYHRFAVTMRSLAETYTREAERIRKENSIEEETEAGDGAQQKDSLDVE
ncbi:MAG: hypothetical protein WC708_13795 [Lentisphaeria bacterium]